MVKRYKVAKNPKDGLWYVVGYTGGKYYIPVSNGYNTKKRAEERMRRNYQADRAARSELLSWDTKPRLE